jgi:hypothetical protein
VTVAKFRSRPAVIEAEQWWPGREIPGVQWEKEYTVEDADVGRRVREGPYVLTAHRERAHLSPGDWVIKEPKGDGYYPCKPAVFMKRWEPLEAECMTADEAGRKYGEEPHYRALVDYLTGLVRSGAFGADEITAAGELAALQAEEKRLAIPQRPVRGVEDADRPGGGGGP